eukprot:9478849-Pyramimonas_sp.AAC.1
MEEARDGGTQRALELWACSSVLRGVPKQGEDRMSLPQRCSTTLRPSRARWEATGCLTDMLYNADIGPEGRRQFVLTQVSDGPLGQSSCVQSCIY